MKKIEIIIITIICLATGWIGHMLGDHQCNKKWEKTAIEKNSGYRDPVDGLFRWGVISSFVVNGKMLPANVTTPQHKPEVK